MRVHVFGNSPSPTVATYGLHRSVIDADSDVQDFVFHNFYVDDGLVGCESEDQAVSLMKRTQRALMGGGKLCLHKIASNSKSVLKQLDQNDFAKDLKSMDLGSDVLSNTEDSWCGMRHLFRRDQLSSIQGDETLHP